MLCLKHIVNDREIYPKVKLMSEKTFSQLGVPAPLVTALTAAGIDSPFPIHVDTLPDTLAGRDVLGRGKSGSGKTLAFCFLLFARLGF